MLRFLQLTVLSLTFGMLGCNEAQPTELPGTWVMDDASRQILPTALEKASARIVLDRNGTFVALNMPGLFFFPEHRDARLESGSGTWKLVLREGRQQLQLDFKEIAGWKKSELPYGTQLEVSKGWSSLSLYYFLGDADEGRRVDFEKQK